MAANKSSSSSAGEDTPMRSGAPLIEYSDATIISRDGPSTSIMAGSTSGHEDKVYEASRNLCDVTKVTDSELQKRSRGRPLKSPSNGPATSAARAASRRIRAAEEISALAHCLYLAMRDLEKFGAHNAIAHMFSEPRARALDAVRRHEPQYASEMEEQSARCRLLGQEFFNRIHGVDVMDGHVKGSILYRQHELVATSTGEVLRNGKATGFRINKEVRAYVVVDMENVVAPRRWHRNQDTKKMALLDVAMILAERESGESAITPDPYALKKQALVTNNSSRRRQSQT